MLAYTRLCLFSMLIAIELYQVSTSYKPITLPDPKEIVINEGETLNVSCKDPMKFVFPDNPEINTSDYIINKDNSGQTIFERSKTVSGDTGWYGCSNHNEITTNFYEMTWQYVYVTSNRSAFVEANANAHLNATVGDSIVIPCRTTSSGIRPVLINGKGDEVNQTSYDSKIGFTIRNLSLDDSESYKCFSKMDDKEYAVNYTLSVDPKQTLTEPKIEASDVLIKRVRELHVNCTEMEVYMRYVFDWNTRPQNSDTRDIQEFGEHFDGYSILVKTVKNLTEVKDENIITYECDVSTSYDKKKITKRTSISYKEVNVDHNTGYTFLMNNSYHQNENGTDIEWDVIIIGSCLCDDIKWFKPNGEKIIHSPKYFISNSSEHRQNDILKKSHLKIISLNVSDSGNYTVQITRQSYYYTPTKNLTVKLDVIDKPNSILTPLDSYYLPNGNKEFRCEVTSNPPPNITWNFLKFSNYPSLENSTIVYPTNVTQSTVYNSSYRFESTVNMPVDISGRLTCVACNEVGCDSATGNILVSDSVPPYFTKTNMNKTETRIIDITGGQNKTILECYADGMPKPTVTWYKDNALLGKKSQYQFKNNDQELQITYSTRQDGGRYSCQANNPFGTNETYQQIIVKDTNGHSHDVVLITVLITVPILGYILIISTIYFTIRIHGRKSQDRQSLIRNEERCSPGFVLRNLISLTRYRTLYDSEERDVLFI